MPAFPQPPLMVISDRKATPLPLALTARTLFVAGLRWFSLREPDLDPVRRMTLLRSICLTAKEFGATVSVHHDIGAALATGAGGLHLSAAQLQAGEVRTARSALGSKVLLGASCHTEEDVARAERDGVDYITLSPIYASASKPQSGPPLGLEKLREWVSATKLPVLALSGVTAERAAECLAAGATGVAVMGGLMRAQDPAAACAAYLAIVRAKIDLKMI